MGPETDSKAINWYQRAIDAEAEMSAAVEEWFSTDWNSQTLPVGATNPAGAFNERMRRWRDAHPTPAEPK
jgi:hypothetical protein